MTKIVPGLLVVMLLSVGLWAQDPWEFNVDTTGGDDVANEYNPLLHGASQVHDLEGLSSAPDLDWFVVPTTANHSYEGRITATSISPSFGACGSCAQFSRVNSGGTILTAQSNPFGQNAAVSVRWTSAATGQSDYLRVTGDTSANYTANHQYTIQLFDTTVFGSRYNNSGTQITVLFVQNTTRAAVTGSIYFYSAAGALVHTEALNVPVQGLQVVNSAAIGALAGTSGSVAIAHNGGYGGITGKTVALEPSTGFSFDTPLVSLPK